MDSTNQNIDAAEIDKFDALAGPICSASRITSMKEAIRKAESYERVGDLMEELAADNYSVPCRNT